MSDKRVNRPGTIKNLKREAMHRQRKVIFDNDGSDRGGPLCQGNTAQDLLEVRAIPAIVAGIDTYIYTTGWGFGIGLHDSKVGSVLKTREGHLAGNMVADFIRNGTDCLQIQCDYAKKRGKEIFWGMRMNDTHDQGYGGVFLPENRFKNETPEVLFGTNLKHGAATAVNYLDERVRSFAVAYIMDVVDRYDIDGVFLDFYRHPIFFPSNTQGLACCEQELAAMTSFMKTVRDELDKRSVLAGKYYIMSVRVPDSAEYSRAIGLDIETWLADELVDMLFTASYLQFNDWEYSAALGHKYGVAVYPSLDESRVKSELPRHKRNCVKGYYGRIMNVWESGCDGVLMFNNSGIRAMSANIEQNWFAADGGNFQEALAATVKGKEYVNSLSKTYFVSFRGVGRVPGGALPHQDYIRIPTLNHFDPIPIRPGEVVEVPLHMAEDVEAASAQGKKPEATATILMSENPASLRIAFNKQPLDFHLSVHPRPDLKQENPEYAVTAKIPLPWLKTGRNIFAIEPGTQMSLLDLWVDMDYSDTRD